MSEHIEVRPLAFQEGRVTERLGDLTLRADRAQVDRPVSPGTDMVQPDCRSTADFAFATFPVEHPLTPFFRQSRKASRKPTSEHMPELLPDIALALLHQDRLFDEKPTKLPHEAGFFAAEFAAVRGTRRAYGYVAVGTVRGILRNSFDRGWGKLGYSPEEEGNDTPSLDFRIRVGECQLRSRQNLEETRED